MTSDIAFVRLTEIDPREIAEHMSDPRVAEHMPLLTSGWDEAAAAKFVAMKEACWARDGLGHWAFLADGRYVGWGGFQREGEEWDFGLVLKPGAFGLGRRISKKAVDFAMADTRISFVTFLLPPSRRHLRALERLGARRIGQTAYGGAIFYKFRLETESAPPGRAGMTCSPRMGVQAPRSTGAGRSGIGRTTDASHFGRARPTPGQARA